MHGLYHAVLRSAPGLPTYLSYKINPDIASTDAANNTLNLPAEELHRNQEKISIMSKHT
jgi:hypothetical protein